MTPHEEARPHDAPPRRIWLIEDHEHGFTWCDDPDPSGCGEGGTEYVRADVMAEAVEIVDRMATAISMMGRSAGSDGQDAVARSWLLENGKALGDDYRAFLARIGQAS